MNLSLSLSLSPSLWISEVSHPLLYPDLLPLSLKLRYHQMKQRLNCKTIKKPTNNEQYSKQKIKNRFEEMTKDEEKKKVLPADQIQL